MGIRYKRGRLVWCRGIVIRGHQAQRPPEAARVAAQTTIRAALNRIGGAA